MTLSKLVCTLLQLELVCSTALVLVLNLGLSALEPLEAGLIPELVPELVPELFEAARRRFVCAVPLSGLVLML
jgi:hypothetical protein